MNPPNIPERISSLAPQTTHDDISEHDRRVEHQISNISISSMQSNISEFLEEKYKACEYDLASSLAQLRTLQEAVQQGSINQIEYDKASEPLFQYQTERFNEKKLLRKQRRLLEADLDEETESKKPRFSEPDMAVYERAYASTMVPRVMDAMSKKKKNTFRQDKFKKAVLGAYNASRKESGANLVWCHALHDWFLADEVKPAHLVPKSLSLAEVGHLFGIEEVPEDFFYDWKLGITLHRVVELGLDQGTIVIVPEPGECKTEWKCILVDSSKASDMICKSGSGTTLWRDLDGCKLEFLGSNRPARRYLYFRFIITVLHAQRIGNTSFISMLKKKDHFWASPGKYIQRATLVGLARNVSAFELPSSLYCCTTFEDEAVGSSEEDAGLLAHDLKAAYVESAKRSMEDDDMEEDDEEEDDEEDDEEKLKRWT